MTDSRHCLHCQQDKPITEFVRSCGNNGRPGSSYCRPCRKEMQRTNALMNLYGISADDYAARLKDQDGVCAICHEPPKNGGKPLFVDHNHTTGQIRGLLCARCNQLIGWLEVDPEIRQKAAGYLHATPEYKPQTGGSAPRQENVTPNKQPSRRGRPPGNGAGLNTAVATRLTPEESEALDALAKKMGFKNRAETIRFIIKSVIGGT